MTNWITKHQKHASNTHYYLGFRSICGAENIATPEPISYSIKIKADPKHCRVCQKILKSKKIHRTITQRKNNLDAAQTKSAEFGVTLQQMMLNRITSEDARAAKIAELKKLFSHDYPHANIEDIILLLVVSQKVRISRGGDTIVLRSMEATHVR